ncbi:hypothetical protein [Phocaeicola sp.]|uniref:hypothetical protein n=1 Tax=Phocaeicola sp. TaxID=2773926 RepID=UPI0023CBF7D1|nr:hypothetical protein [Phocaeicola sp.]MDE5677617.1 hypothetical protein [Phocaeicola sp.]
MDIIQVITLLVIISAAIIQQAVKSNREKKNFSLPKTSPDKFETEEEPSVQETSAPSVTNIYRPRPTRSSNLHKPKNTLLHQPTVPPKTDNSPVRLNTKEEARRAFIYSEIFNRKY